MPFINFTPPKEICNSPEHEPPGMIVLPAGEHTYQCPRCGEVHKFTVEQINCHV